MKNKSKHLSKEERFLIAKMLHINKGISYIAKLLDRGVSTISEEIARNGGITSYDSTKANFEATVRQMNKKISCNKVVSNTKIKKYVDRQISEGMSPEKISNNIKTKFNGLNVSNKSIRKYLKYNKTIYI